MADRRSSAKPLLASLYLRSHRSFSYRTPRYIADQINRNSLKYLQFTGSVNGDSGSGGTRVRTVGLDLLDNVVTVSHLTKDNVLTVQPWAGNSGDEELRTVGVWTSVGHRQQTWSVVGLGKVLVSELLTVDGSTTGSVTSGKVTTLQHELRNDSVESRVGVTETLFTGTQGSEVFGGLWHNVVVQLEGDSTELVAVGGNVEVNLGHGKGLTVGKLVRANVWEWTRFIRFFFFFPLVYCKECYGRTE